MKQFFTVLGLLAFSLQLHAQKSAETAQPKVQRKPAQIQSAQALFIGHNLTPSTEVIGKYKFTVGNYAAGFGLTDNLFIATSPWIWYSYNTMNLHLKYSKDLNAKSTIGFFASYFDSYNSENLMYDTPQTGGPGFVPFAGEFPTGAQITAGTNRYQWTSYSAHALYSYRYDNGVTQYFNAKYSYYLNDEMPYSLRMDPGLDSIRDQVDVSTMLKVPLSARLSWAVEAGMLGLNYISPYAHLGTSLVIQKQNWLVQLGASYTAPLSELGSKSALEVGRMDNRTHYSEIANQYYTERYLQVAVHPEIQIQFSF